MSSHILIRFLITCLFLMNLIYSFAQPSLSEIKKYKIKSTIETTVVDSITDTKKTVYNAFGHDSLIYYGGELSFYSRTETNDGQQINQLSFYNAQNDALEELHMFSYSKDGSYKVKVIAHGAGLIDTRKYNANHLLIKTVNSDDIETTYEYNSAGKLEKVFQKQRKGKKKLIVLTTFNQNGLELKTEVYGEEPSEIFYEHNLLGLIAKVKLSSKVPSSMKEKEVNYQYEFYEK